MKKPITIVLIAFFIFSCADSKLAAPKKDFRANMREAQKLSAELFSYVWNEESFNSPRNEQKIKALLSDLGRDFHEIKKSGSSLELEPGFHVVLATQRELIQDISSRFETGNKDYALWRLKGMSQNCIACHSRLNVPYDFFGEVNVKGVEGKFAEAEFLFASRKFDLASEKFLQFAKKEGKKSYLGFLALKYWILIELRVKGRFVELDVALNDIYNQGLFNKEQQQIIKHWQNDLPQAQKLNLDSLLGFPKQLETLDALESEYLVTVAATSLLHSFLDSNPLTDKRKRALLNLGASYLNLSLPSLAVFGPMYLEQTIREFPKTKEAKLAYQLYKSNMELEFTGSTGIHLDDTQKDKLKKLKRLANAS